VLRTGSNNTDGKSQGIIKMLQVCNTGGCRFVIIKLNPVISDKQYFLSFCSDHLVR
jgi:hypothetical protein